MSRYFYLFYNFPEKTSGKIFPPEAKTLGKRLSLDFLKIDGDLENGEIPLP